MNCIIVDDDEMSRNALKHFADQTEFLTVTSLCASAMEASRIVANEKPDLVLLDIEMPEMNGLEFIKLLPEKTLVILTTSQEKYAVKAFEYDIVDYLLKPFSYSRFFNAITKAKEIFASSAKLSDGESFFVKTNSSFQRINIHDILWVEALGDYVSVNLPTKKYTVHSTLKSVELMLGNDKFIRVHRSFLVAIDKINTLENSVIVMNDKLIPVGAVYRENLMKRLKFF